MTRQKRPKKIKRYGLTVKSYSYQPSRAEIKQEIGLKATPDAIARAVLRDVKIKLDK